MTSEREGENLGVEIRSGLLLAIAPEQDLIKVHSPFLFQLGHKFAKTMGVSPEREGVGAQNERMQAHEDSSVTADPFSGGRYHGNESKT